MVVSDSMAAEIKIPSSCEWSRPAGAKNYSFPLRGQAFAKVQMNFNPEKNVVDFDFSEIFRIAEIEPSIGYSCFYTILNSKGSRMIAELCRNEDREKENQCMQSSYDVVLKTDDVYEEKRSEALRKGAYADRIVPGEIYFGDEMEKPANDLREGCGGYNHSDVHLTKTFMQGPLPQILEEVSQDCRREILDYYSNALAEDYAKAVRGTQLKSRDRRLQGVNIALDELFQLYTRYTNELTYEQLSRFRCQEDNDRKLSALNHVMDQLADELRCLPMQEGASGSREIYLLGRNSPTGLPANYKITKSANTYKIEVPIQFENSEGRDDEELQGFYRQLSNACFAEYADVLKDSQGRKLEISIPEPNYNANRVRIIEDGEHRSSSTKWKHSIDCETIIHEVMHLLGLCDEYKENWNGYVFNEEKRIYEWVDSGAEFKGSNCRAVGPKDSIMSSQKYALNETIVYEMQCSKASLCDGTRYKTTAGELEKVKETYLEMQKKYPDIYGEEPFVLKVVERISPRGLSQTHMNAILYPGCLKKNATYYTCAKNAYLTAIDDEAFHLKECPLLPKECRDGSSDWVQW